MGRGYRVATLYSVDPFVRIATMMQAYASAAKLRGGRPNLLGGTESMEVDGSPPPRIVIGSSLQL
jgi:hypothetical protein